MLTMSDNLWPFQLIFNMENSQKSHRQNLTHMGIRRILSDLLAKNTQKVSILQAEQRYGSRSKYNAKVQAFSAPPNIYM